MARYDRSFSPQQSETPRWVIIAAVVIVLLGILVGGMILRSGGGKSTRASSVAAQPSSPQVYGSMPPVHRQRQVAPINVPRRETESPRFLASGASSSFDSLAAELPAQVGLAVAPLGSTEVREFGDLREGHAWSSIKVPILVTLMHDLGSGGLNSEEQAWAASAITASDNAAAASLFQQLEKLHGGLSGASLAVQEVLEESGDLSTVIATQPPPSGAVSTYGQTEWSLAGSVQFYRSLAQGCLIDSADTEYVEGLMEEVIPEQRWGLGEAGFQPGWRVAMKGGWGPEGSAEGPYLVRQSGIIRSGTSGVAVTMIALDNSGSYGAGAEDLTRMAGWLAEQLHGLGPPARESCP